ncbi:MAG: sensor histidine kinase [Owenweeksia sp.]
MSEYSSFTKRLSLFISGPEDVLLENKIFNTATFSLAVLTIIIAVITLQVTSNVPLYIPLILAPVVFSLFFYNSRFREHFRSTSYLFIVFSLAFFDYVWFTAVAFNQAVDLLFLLILTLGLTILPVKRHFTFTLVCILNILIINWLAHLFPHWIYPTESSHSFISYLTGHIFLISCIVLVALVIAYFKKAYEKERLASLEQNRQLSNINQALHNRNEHLEGLARMVSHNLRSPIAGIKMLLNLYDRMESPEEREDIVNNLKEGAFTLFDMVEDLSAIMLDYKELNKEKESLELNEVASAVVSQLSGQIKSSDARVSLNFSKYPEVIYSKTYLESIFLNLISNALKYRSPDRTPVIEVSSYQEDNKVMLSVKDNGLGLDLNQHREQLFKMYKTFHRDSGTDSKGIGLFITKNQVEMMGGKISVKSTPDEGSTFFVELYRV